MEISLTLLFVSRVVVVCHPLRQRGRQAGLWWLHTHTAYMLLVLAAGNNRERDITVVFLFTVLSSPLVTSSVCQLLLTTASVANFLLLGFECW